MKKEIIFTDAAFELKLYAENTGRIYPQKLAIYKNLNKHNRHGNFDLLRATDAFMPWLVIAAAVALANEYQAEYTAGNMARLDAE